MRAFYLLTASALVLATLPARAQTLSVTGAATANQTAVQGALNSVAAPSADLTGVLQGLSQLSPLARQLALTQIAGTIHAQTALVLANGSQAANAMMMERLFATEGDAPLSIAFGTGIYLMGDKLAANGDVRNDATPYNPARSLFNGAWTQGVGSWNTVNGDANAPGYTSSSGSVTAGYDRLVSKDVRLGAAFSYTRTDVDEQDSATAKIDTYRAQLYGNYNAGPLSVGGGISAGFDTINSNRLINLGATSRTALSDHNAHDISASFDTGYIVIGGPTTLAPFFSLDYVHLRESAFTESNAGALDMTVNPQTYDSLQPELGLRLGHRVDMGNGAPLEFEIHAGARYEALDRSATTSALLAGAPNGVYTVQGPRQDRAMADFGARVLGHVGRAVAIYAAYGGQFSGTQHTNSVGGGVRVNF